MTRNLLIVVIILGLTQQLAHANLVPKQVVDSSIAFTQEK